MLAKIGATTLVPAAMQAVSSAMRVGDDIWVSSNDDRVPLLAEAALSTVGKQFDTFD